MDKSDIATKLSILRSNDENVEIWSELIITYISDVIIPNLSELFIKRFPFIYIACYPKTGYVDYIINSDNGLVEKVDLPNQNKYITFTRDSSLECNDKIPVDPFSVRKDVAINTVHCEIVTPIIKKYTDIVLLYDNIISPKCMHINSTTSFHINISFKDDVYFSDTLINCILENFREFESLNYRNESANKESPYAIRIYENVIKNILNEYGDMMYTSKNDKFTYDNFVVGERYYRSYVNLNRKYNSLYLKNPAILEFRLFSSSKDIPNLLKYIEETTNLIQQSYNYYINNIEKITTELQGLNLKCLIDYNPLHYYIGNLYYKDTDFQPLEIVESTKNIEKGLKFLFGKRSQDVKELLKIKDNSYIINAFVENEKYSYSMKITRDYVFEIEKL